MSLNDKLNAITAQSESGSRDRDASGKLIVSRAGAEGRMQVMPSTRLDPGYGVQPARDDSDAERTRVGEDYRAALTDHYGDVAKGWAAYNFGPGNFDRAVARATQYGTSWMTEVPKETRDYVNKNMSALGQTSPDQPAPINTDGKRFKDMGLDEILYGRAIVPPKEPKSPPLNAERLAIEGMGGPVQRKIDQGNTADIADMQAHEAQGAALATEQRATSFGDKVGAAFKTNLTMKAIGAIDRLAVERDPDFKPDVNEVFAWSKNQGEVQMLMGSTSQAQYDLAKTQLEKQREAQHTMTLGGGVLPDNVDATLASLAGSIIDPASIAAFAATDGVSGLFEGAAATGLVGKALAGARSGALGNVAVTAGLQAAGEHTSLADYLHSAATGALLGAAVTPFFHRSGEVDTGLAEAAREARKQADVQKAQVAQRAQQALGPEATPEQLRKKMSEIELKDTTDFIQGAMSNVPQERRLMPATEEATMTADPAVKDRMVKDHNLDLLPDAPERDSIAELLANAERINKQYPTNTKGLTRATGMLPGAESTGMTLMKAEGNLQPAIAKVLLESTTGAGGRGETAAMSMALHERLFNQHMFGWADLYHEFRKSEGRGVIAEHLDPKAQREFNERIYYEIHSRQDGHVSTETNPVIRKAADMFEHGMEAMRSAQVTAKTVGFARLPETAVGYAPHKLSVERVATMNAEQKRAVLDILSKQFQELNQFRGEGGALVNFDKEFSDELAKKYINRAVEKQAGMFEIPVNLHEPDAANILSDTLEAMQMDPAKRTAIQQAYSRGGAGHTKGRLNLDMNAKIPDGAGGEMRLGNLFEQDMLGLYRGYSRRVAGEVALAQHGIMGAKGLKVLRQAIIAEGKWTEKSLGAFDQMSSEFLNQSFGNRKHVWMDNISLATSAARLGMSVFNQFGDFSNATLALGVTRAFSVIPELPRIFREVGAVGKGGESTSPILKSLDPMGYVGLDDYQATRLFDQKDHNVAMYGQNNVGRVGRALKSAVDAQYILTGHRRLVAAQTRGMSEQIVRKVIEFVHLGKEDVALKDMGLSPELQAKLRANMGQIAHFKSGKLQSLDIHAGDLTHADKMELRSVIDRGSGQIIQRTYIGETAPWVHDSMLSLLYKFRTYSITAMEKQWSRNTMNYGHLIAFATLMGSMSWAVPIHMARLQIKTLGMNDSDREDYLKKNGNPLAMARAVANYTAAVGLLPDIIDVGAGYGAIAGGDTGKAIYQNMGQGGSKPGGQDILGGVVAPPLGLLQDAWEGSHGNAHKLLKLIPGSNTMFVQPFFNATASTNH